MIVQQAQNRVGQQLGNYRLMKLVGRGGYAEVYLAENVYLSTQVAIKVLRRNLDQLEQDQFRNEAKFTTTLQHPRIIKVFDYGIESDQQGNNPYLVMEYAPSGTLRNLYPQKAKMELAKIASYTRQVAEALQYAHDQNITHLDVKPENMLVRRPDDVALSDFGIAVSGMNTNNLGWQQEEIVRKLARGEKLDVPGTAAYLAPERLNGHTQRASDQYSLAIVVYEWLTGRRPFTGSDYEICARQIKEPPPSLRQIDPTITPEIEQVIMKALEKNPAQRYKSVLEFSQALESAIQNRLKSTQSVTHQSNTPPSSVTQLPNTPPSPFPRPQNPPPVVPPVQPTQPNPQRPNLQQPGPQRPGPQPPNPQQPRPQPPVAPAQKWYDVAGNLPPTPAGPLPNKIYLPPSDNSQPGLPESYDAMTVDNNAPAGPKTQGPGGLKGELLDVINEPLTMTRQMLRTDRHFINTKRTRNFRILGTLFNVSAAFLLLISGFIPPQTIGSSVILAIVGGIVSVMLLRQCTITLKKSVALLFGAGIALWWGIVAIGFAVHLPDKGLALPLALLAFGISFAIHYWYVENRLKN